jgi:hypothetical protein
MDLKSLRGVASGLLLAALLCALPVAAAAAPTAHEEGAASAWWQGLQQRVAEWVAVWIPPSPAVEGELRLREPNPPKIEPRLPGLRPVLANDGGNSQCTGEGGPGWDPDGCQ